MAGLITFDVTDLQRKGEALTPALEFGSAMLLDRTAEGVANRLKGGVYWRNRSNKARDSVAMRITGPWKRRVQVRVRYGQILDEGSKPHEISARRRRALRFSTGGGTIFRRRVWRHPGTKGFHFSQKEQALVGDSLPRGAEQVRDKAVAQVGLS